MPIISVVVISAVIISVIYYAYYSIYLPQTQDKIFADVANSNPNGRTITVFMFHVNWCPHCKKALPEWTIFKDKYNKTVLNGYVVECIDIDCTDTDKSNIASMLEKYNLEYFPTIKGVLPDTVSGKELVVDYDAKVTNANLEKFVMSLSSDS